MEISDIIEAIHEKRICLIYGQTVIGDPVHIVCGLSILIGEEINVTIR